MEITSLISSLGFPIAVCLWFMFRMEKVLNNNTEAVVNLTNAIDVLCLKNQK